MHVCHFCDCSFGGDYFRNIAAGLTMAGIRLSLVQLGPGTAPTWLAGFPEVSYASLGAAGRLSYPAAALRLARFLRRNEVDILHMHLFNAGLVGVLAKRLHGKTIVALMRHHTSVVRMLGTRLHVAIDKWMAERADHVMTVSDAARRYMREVDGIGRHIDVVHHGLDYEKVAPDAAARRRVRDEFGLGENFVVGYVGNFALGKGHTQLIEAFGQIEKEIAGARLLLVGEGLMAAARDLTARLGLTENVIFTGWRDDPLDCMNAVDIFVQPSLSEAFSQVLLEAMGVGLPVVATKVGGAEEVITDGSNGLLIAPYDSGAIAEKILMLYRQADMRHQIGAAARESVRQTFSAEEMVEKHVQLYRSWLGKEE